MTYELPTYELKVNALEIGIILGMLWQRKGEFPALTAKFEELSQSFYPAEEESDAGKAK